MIFLPQFAQLEYVSESLFLFRENEISPNVYDPSGRYSDTVPDQRGCVHFDILFDIIM